MATRYCELCGRLVDGRRHFGFGTLALSVLTGGAWFLVLPFYRKRCPICRTVVRKRRAERPVELTRPARALQPEGRGRPPAPPLTRKRVIEHLSERFSRDEISLPEFERRVTAAYAAKTPGELAALAPGLRWSSRMDDGPAGAAREPGGRSGVPDAGARPARRRRSSLASSGVGGARDAAATPPHAQVSAVLGSVQKADLATMPRHLLVRSMVGSVELDLRRAAFAPGSTEIEVNAVAGNVEIRLPSRARVETREKGIFSSLELKEGPSVASGGGGKVDVVITGRLVLSNVTVHRDG
jgi:hypothetical protein